MIRSNLLLRRIASSIAPKNLAAPLSSSALSCLAPPSATTSTITTSISLAWSPLSISTSIPPPTSRPFSSSASKNLRNILQREIDEEEDASSQYDGKMPPELAELHSDISADWSILEGISGIGSSSGPTGSGASIRMFKKTAGSNGAKIGIVFHCQDTEEDDDSFFDEEGNFEQNEEEDEEKASAVRFGVTVSKGGKTVVMQCRYGMQGVTVESVSVRDGDTEAVLLALAGGEGLHASLYAGPEFDELAEDLRDAFSTYVRKECGINEDVLAFISMYADYREQEEYVSWMKSAVNILS